MGEHSGNSGNKDPKNNVVFQLNRSSRCYNCDERMVAGEFVVLKYKDEDKEALCASCAGIDELEVVQSGNAELTKLTSRYSVVRYVIMRWSDVWKAYERQGILVDSDAVARAKAEINGTPLPAPVVPPNNTDLVKRALSEEVGAVLAQ